MDLQDFHESGAPHDCRTAGKSLVLESKTSILKDAAKHERLIDITYEKANLSDYIEWMASPF